MDGSMFDLKKLTECLKKYRYALLVLLVGAALMLWPTGNAVRRTEAPSQAAASSEWSEYDLSQLEQRLAGSLSSIRGVGKAEVVLTLQSGSRRILAQDSDTGNGNARTTTVILNTGSGVQDTVTTQVLSPVFQGALVVCDGGSSPSVRLEVVHAVEALTGLRADKIAVSQRTVLE